MASEAFKTWYVQGLQAVRTAADQAHHAAGGAQGQDASPEVQAMIEAGAALFGRHAETLAALLQEAGSGPGRQPNPFMDGIRAGSREMIEAAGDPDVRTASVVAAAQIATHYFIAAYGTLASNAKHLGLADAAETLKDMADAMKDGDARLTEVAETLANRRASSAG